MAIVSPAEVPKNSGKSDGAMKVFQIAIISRAIVLGLIIFWRSIASPYDTSASLNPPCLRSTESSRSTESIRFPEISRAIEESVVWDGVYFVRIAECGYEYEQTYAFLPLLPICISFLTRSVFAPFVPLLGYRAVLALSAYILNNLAFCFASVYLYRLSLCILRDHKAAFRASIMFCFNPASVFYSSIYSESLYALFSIGGLYYIYSRAELKAVLFLSFSGSARSNGMINAGYFCYQAMHQIYNGIQRRKFLSVMHAAVAGIVRSVFISLPFILFQAYGFHNLCRGEGSLDAVRPWCSATIPYLYGFIQGHYWGVGFLKYFQVKQLPNFLLASPILWLAAHAIIQYAQSQPSVFFSLGFSSRCYVKDNHGGSSIDANSSKSLPSSETSFANISRANATLIQRREHKKDYMISEFSESPLSSISSEASILLSPDEEADSPSAGYRSILMNPFILHMLFLVAVAFFVMHVQVATRFLSASPPIYWCASYLVISPNHNRSRRWGYFIWVYFMTFVLLGSLLFSNFYPFT